MFLADELLPRGSVRGTAAFGGCAFFLAELLISVSDCLTMGALLAFAVHGRAGDELSNKSVCRVCTACKGHKPSIGHSLSARLT